MISVGDLQNMDRVALVATWSQIFSTPTPKGISRAFLRRFLAYELQARQSGGLPREVQIGLARRDVASARPKTPALRSGGRLLREWNGVTHTVDVTEAGFLWNGAAYRSLSAIAKAITGAHWSGPRFFGLNGQGG